MATKGGVPETLLKKRKRDEQWAANRAASSEASKKKAKAGRKEIFKRAEQYVKEYRNQVGASCLVWYCQSDTGLTVLLLVSYRCGIFLCQSKDAAQVCFVQANDIAFDVGRLRVSLVILWHILLWLALLQPTACTIL